MPTQRTLLLLLFLAGFVPRALGADVGYFYGDERINEAAKVLTGQLVPGQHFYPPLLNYLNAIAFAGLFALGVPLGWWDSLSGFRAQYFADPTVFFVTARLMVASMGALLAPFAFLIARHFGLRVAAAVAIGLLASLFPLAILLSHIAKGDVPLGAATALCFLMVARRVSQGKSGASWPEDSAIGWSFAVALSFKQSAVFSLFPLSLGMLFLLSQRYSFRIALRSFFRALMIFVLIWAVLNVGIVLDFRRFLEFQSIQSAMSLSEYGEGWFGIAKMLRTSVNPQNGVGWVLAPVAAIGILAIRSEACKVTDKPLWLVLWSSSVTGAISLAFLAGTRQPDQLFVAPFGEFLILAAVLVCGFSQSASRILVLSSKIAIAASLLIFCYYAIPPVSQALRAPLADTVDAYLNSEHAEERIVTMMPTEAKQAPDAWIWEQERLLRLAQKYKIDLPEVAPETRASKTAADALFWVPLPQAMYGLEDIKDGEETYDVQAHTWPLQPEEWRLEFWQRQSFSVFVLVDVAYHLNHRPSELISLFFEEIISTCDLAKTFEPLKPIYLEYITEVYLCL